MGGPTKDKKNTSACEKDTTPRGRGFEIAVGTKVEAMDYMGTWYNAKIIKLKPDKKEVLIHFDGWNSRFDVWLPYDSKKLREAKPVKHKGHDWRIGARVVAKWGPANKIYPAIVSKIISETCVEVRFYDGFKKTIKKSTLQPDTEKLYRQYGEGSAIKDVLNFSTPGDKKRITSTSTPNSDETNAGLRAKRRLTEPPGMADYVTEITKKSGRRSLRGGELPATEISNASSLGDSTLQDTLSPIPSTQTIKKEKKLSEKIPEQTGDTKFKTENERPSNGDNNEKILSIEDEEKISSHLSSSIPKLKLRKGARSQSNVEIVKSNVSSYMMFPIMSSPDDSDDNSSVNNQSIEPSWEIASPPNALVTSVGDKITTNEIKSEEGFEIGCVVEHDKENVLEASPQLEQQKDDKDGEKVSKNALSDKGFCTQTKEYSLFTDMSSKLPENTQETRRRRSDPKISPMSSESLRKRIDKDESVPKPKSVSSDSDEDKTLKAVKQAKDEEEARNEKQKEKNRTKLESKKSKDTPKGKTTEVKENVRSLRNKESKVVDSKESPRLTQNKRSESPKNESTRRSLRDTKTKEANDKPIKTKEITVKLEPRSPTGGVSTPRISLSSSEKKSEEKHAERSLRLRDSKLNTPDEKHDKRKAAQLEPKEITRKKSIDKKQDTVLADKKNDASSSVNKISKETKIDVLEKNKSEESSSKKGLNESGHENITERRSSRRSATTEEVDKKDKNADQVNIREKKIVDSSTSSTRKSLRGRSLDGEEGKGQVGDGKGQTGEEKKSLRRSSRGSKEDEKEAEDKNKDSRAMRAKRRHILEEEKKKESESPKTEKTKITKSETNTSSNLPSKKITTQNKDIVVEKKIVETTKNNIDAPKLDEEFVKETSTVESKGIDDKKSKKDDSTDGTKVKSVEERKDNKELQDDGGITNKTKDCTAKESTELCDQPQQSLEISIKEEADSFEEHVPCNTTPIEVTPEADGTEQVPEKHSKNDKSQEKNEIVPTKPVEDTVIKTDVVNTLPTELPGGKGYIYTTNVVNIFQEIVPDLNSGRPVRKNKLKKPARYSNESEELSHSKSKKEAKDTTVPKTTPHVNIEKPSTKVRRDSRDRKLSSDGKERKERKTSVDNKEIRERKLSVNIADIAPKLEKESTEIKSSVTQTAAPLTVTEIKTEKPPNDTPIDAPTEDVEEAVTLDIETSSASFVKKSAAGAKIGSTPRVRRDSKDMGARRNEDNIPIKGSKITKAKIALQTVTGRKHGVVNKKFEEKYEMFKQKWKEEKERRRLLQQQHFSGSMTSAGDVTIKKTVIGYENVKAKTQSVKTKGSPIKIKMWGEKLGSKVRSRIKHTPHSRFGKALQGHSPVKKKKVKTMQQQQPKAKNENEVMETPPVVEVLPNEKEEYENTSGAVVKEKESPEPLIVEKTEGIVILSEGEIEKASIAILSKEKEPLTNLTKKGKPRKKRKIQYESVFNNDTSRTPNDTISFASMIENERPSQKKRPDSTITTSQPTLPQVNKSPMKYPIPSPQKVFPPRYVIPNYQQRPFFAYAPRPYSYPTAAQIVASRIQKRVHHQKLMAMLNSPDQHPPPQYKGNIDLCNYPPSSVFSPQEKEKSGSKEGTLSADDSDDSILVVQPSMEASTEKGEKESSEIDLTDIALDKSTRNSAPPKKRQSLDFITARLNYKQKIKRQRIDSVVGRLKNNQEVEQQQQQQQQQQQPVPATIHQQHPPQEGIPMSYPGYPGPQQMRPMPARMMTMPPSQMPPNATMYLPMQRMPVPMSPAQVVSPHQHRMMSLPHGPMMRPGEFTNVHPYSGPIMGPLEHHHMMQQQGFIRPGPHMHPFPNPALAPHLHHRMMHPQVGVHPVAGFPPQPPPHDGGSGGTIGKTGIPTKDMKTDEKVSEDSKPETDKTSTTSSKKTPVKKESSDEKTGTEPIEVKEEATDEKRLIIDESANNSESKKRRKSASKQQPGTEKENLYALRREKRARNSKESDLKKIKVETDKTQSAKDTSAPTTPSLPSSIDSFTTPSTTTTALTEYKCTMTDCGKVFRKSHLLEYHIKYFHTAKPFQKRSRSSASVSFTESSPIASSTASAETSPKALTGVMNQSEDLKSLSAPSSEVEFTEQSDSTMSESESESEDEIPSVDDCVKCLCEDECELGFMIQCEQCFTWQHGECVGYSSPKSVPLFYLCHVCSNPKGLRKSSKYDNDYTWYRHGLLPPLRQDAPEDAKLDELEFNKHVALENEEILSTIMLATHAMTTDLYNIRDVLQGIRNKFTLINDPKNPNLMDWNGESDDKIFAEMLEKMKEDDTKPDLSDTKTNVKSENDNTGGTKNITEMFNKDLNKRLTTINNKNNASFILNNELPIEKSSDSLNSDINPINVKDKSTTNGDKIGSSSNDLYPKSVEEDVSVVVSSMVQMLCYTAEKDNSLKTHCESKLKEMNSHNISKDSSRKVGNNTDKIIVSLCPSKKVTISDDIVRDVKIVLDETIDKIDKQGGSDEDIDITNEDFILNDILDNILSRVCQDTSDDKPDETVNLDETLPYMKETPDRPVIVSEQNNVPSKGVRHLLKENHPSGPFVKNGSHSDHEDDYIDVANLSEEDSIPYMETDEEFFPINDQPNRNDDSRSILTSDGNKDESFRQLTCHGVENILEDQGDWSTASRESLIARYNILVEIEKVEDQINERLQDMNAKLDELESEYASIDKSKAILEDFKRNFKLPDLKSLMSYLKDVKWKSIIKSSMESSNVSSGGNILRSVHA